MLRVALSKVAALGFHLRHAAIARCPGLYNTTTRKRAISELVTFYKICEELSFEL